MDQFIDDFVLHIETAAAQDAKRWPQYNQNADERSVASKVKERLNQKVNWLLTQWGEPSHINKVNKDNNNYNYSYDLLGRMNASSKVQIKRFLGESVKVIK